MGVGEGLEVQLVEHIVVAEREESDDDGEVAGTGDVFVAAGRGRDRS